MGWKVFTYNSQITQIVKQVPSIRGFYWLREEADKDNLDTCV